MRILRSVTFLSLLMATCTAADFRVHAGAIAPTAGDGAAAEIPATGDGSPEVMYRSLTQARDAIRAARKAGTLKDGEPITVTIDAGVYRLDSTFELTAEDSGKKDSPVIYRAKTPGTVHFHGGPTLAAEAFKPVSEASVLAKIDPLARSKIMVCDVSAYGKFDAFKTAFNAVPASPWLYANSQPLPLARWPNANATGGEWATFTKAVDNGYPQPNATDPALRKLRPGSFIFDDARPARWNLEDGVWLNGYWTHDWSSEFIRIGSYDKDKHIITLAAPHGYGVAVGTWGGAPARRFYALNLIEELDAPGEWFLDRTINRLYLYPPGPLTGSEVVLATLSQPMVKISGAKHLRLSGLNFKYGHSRGLVLQNTESVEISGCVVANVAGDGISVDGRENTIRSCDLFNLGMGGIIASGGNRKTLEPGKNLVVNNHIHHYGLFVRTYAAGIGLEGCGNIVRNNRIHDAPHNAIKYGGNEQLIELNEIYRVVMETGDAGALYSGRDRTTQGNMIRHNFIHDLGGVVVKEANTMGVYLDDCDCGDTIEGNIFLRAGRAIMIGGGRDNPILNNLVIDCLIGLHIDSRGMNPTNGNAGLEAKAKVFNYTQPPWSLKYPRLAAVMNENPSQPLNNPIRRNVFVNCEIKVCQFDGNVMKLLDKFEITDNVIVNAVGSKTTVQDPAIKGFTTLSGTAREPIDLGFKDLKNGSLALRKGALLLKIMPSFGQIPVNRIGLFTDEHRQALPSR